MNSNKHRFFSYLGIDSKPASHREKIISASGGFIGIFCVYIITQTLVGNEAALIIVPSMGATAVLVFAVPHSTLGQIWNVLGGHLLSATVGVLCALMIADQSLAAAASVGLAIAAMYYARCIHPPGGATALAAVVGGESVQSLGFEYLITPVAINVIVILAIAIGFNALFKWRRYPACLVKNDNDSQPVNDDYAPIEHADLVYALSQIDTIIDVTENDLLRIYQLATGREVRTPQGSEST
jgi:CBS domain-containing membrane protein